MMVNVSASQLRSPGFARQVEQVLAQAGLEPAWLGIELTETAWLHDMGSARAELARLRAAGVAIALDDFGTGYSSLSCLARLPVDAVKIDRSLVPALTGDADALALTRAIVAMAHCLGLKVVAEGVETEAQLEVLAANRCDAFQGWHFSPALPAPDVAAMLRAGRRLPLPSRRAAERAHVVVAVDTDATVLRRLRQELPWRFGDGVCVETYADPRAAERRLKQGRVDVVAAGLHMPGMDGIALMERARALQPDAVRVMLLGAHDMARVLDDERQVDVFRYLSKPWTTEQFQAHFGAALEQADRRRAALALSESLDAAQALPHALELLRLEDAEPGLTAVARGPLDEVLLPSQLMTLPGDLWAPQQRPAS
jgi:CheY-like chemotaxis protein